MTSTDEALMACLAQRDENALRELHRRYAALVFSVATRVVGTAAAEEVVQDVFVTLWEKHPTFDPARGAFKPWLLQITRRRALNKLRDARAEARHDDAAIDEVASDGAPPDEAQWCAYRREVIRAAVDALPETQRQALSLAFFDELTHEQIAKVLGTPVGTAKTRIRLGLKRLAPVLLAALATAVIVAIALRREQYAARSEEALKVVTASDVVPLRLAPTPDAPSDAHGNYRSRPGASVAVFTTSHLPLITDSETYVAWSRGRDGWRRLGAVVIEKDGRSLLVAPVGAASPVPEEIEVTREAGRSDEAPSGPIMLQWRASDAVPQ
jgi:RNA polymerase sigma-70 factor (ECF subfamily)